LGGRPWRYASRGHPVQAFDRELLGPTADELMLVVEEQRERRMIPASLESSPSEEFWHKSQARMDWLIERIMEQG
jgi:hypothetical protein